MTVKPGNGRQDRTGEKQKQHCHFQKILHKVHIPGVYL